MIGAPTNFRHIEGAKIGASGRMEQIKGKFTVRFTEVIQNFFSAEKKAFTKRHTKHTR